MRTLKLSHEDFGKIYDALNYVFDQKLKLIKDHKSILTGLAYDEIRKDAKEVSDLMAELKNGDKDI